MVRAEQLSKTFRHYSGLRQRLLEKVTGRPRHVATEALKDISFEVLPGEVMGILGHNGAGKSTLLRILSGTLQPSSGRLWLGGRISSILELGTGFHPDFSGRENVLLGGRCLGLSRFEVARKFDEIVEFAELGSVIDRPLRTYSSGMQGRLAFATALAVDPDILVIDEALSAGDAAFVNKCLTRLRQLCSQSGKTVLFVTHNSYLVTQLCQRALWLERGTVRMCGSALEVVREYDYSVHQSLGNGGEVAHSVFKRGPVEIERVELLNGEGRGAEALRTWDALVVRVHYRCPQAVPVETLGMALALNRRSDLMSLCQFSTANVRKDSDHGHYHQAEFRRQAGEKGVIEARLDPLQLAEGDYLLSVGLLPNQPGATLYYEYHHLLYSFSVLRDGYPFGSVFYPMVSWRHEPCVPSLLS